MARRRRRAIDLNPGTIAESGLLRLDRQRLGPLGAVMNANKLHERLLTRIPEPTRSDPHDPEITAVAVSEPGGDGFEQDRNGLLVPKCGKCTATGSNGRSLCLGPLLPAFAFTPFLPLGAVPLSSRRQLRSRLFMGSDFLARVMSFSTNGRSSLAFGTVVTIRPFTFGAFLSSASNSPRVRSRLAAMFLNMALRWVPFRPSVRPLIR